MDGDPCINVSIGVMLVPSTYLSISVINVC